MDAVPKSWGDNITVTAALTLDGIVAPMILHGAMNARAFEAYVQQCLVPELRAVATMVRIARAGALRMSAGAIPSRISGSVIITVVGGRPLVSDSIPEHLEVFESAVLRHVLEGSEGAMPSIVDL